MQDCYIGLCDFFFLAVPNKSAVCVVLLFTGSIK